MMCSREEWKQDIRPRNFFLDYPHPAHFTRFEWGWPVVYLCWRLFWAAYHLTWIVVSGVRSWEWASSKANEVKWFIYLTDWNYFVLTLATLTDAVMVCYVFGKRKDIINDKQTTMPWYIKTVWVLVSISNVSNILITILYWGLLYTAGMTITAVDIATHAVNTVYVILNLMVTAAPIRIYHFFHGVIYGAVYAIFSVIYQKAGGTNGMDQPYIYKILDWDNPGTAAMYSCLTVLVAIPVVHFIVFLLYKLRLAMFNLCLKRSEYLPKGSLETIECSSQNK